MSASSQDPSFHLLSCKWAWCRSTFSTNAGLVYHVAHNHVHCATPIRRRDIPMIRRAEEGRAVEPPEGPSLSLPSPPASSPALHSPRAAPSPSPLSLEYTKNHTLTKPRNPDHISHQNSPHLTSFKLLKGQNPPANQITTFASLSSLSPEPECSPFSLEIPDSPSFSSLVEGPNKRKTTSNAADRIDINQDAQGVEDSYLHSHPSNGLLSQASDVLILSSGSTHEDDACREELQWEPSQPAEKYLIGDSTLQSQLNHRHLENLPVMSQPPSQLRLDSEFPFHFHDHPRDSISRAHIHTGLDLSTAMPPSSPSPVSSPTFAVSTPVRQNWYQPPLKQGKRSACNDNTSGPSSLRTEVPVSRTRSKKMFRSGTLQITPVSLSKAEHALSMDIDFDVNRQNTLATSHSPYDLEIFSQSPQDSSGLSEILSYPALQTQAPYQSQTLTQF